MLLWCLKDGYSALTLASYKGRKSVVEFLLFVGSDYTDCKDNALVKDALVKYRQEIMALLDPWLPVPDLCAIVTEYCIH